MLSKLLTSSRKGRPPKIYPLGVRRNHAGQLTYNDERNQARFDQVFVMHAMMEIEATRGRSSDGAASSQGALEMRSGQGVAFKPPSFEERLMSASLPVRRDEDWFDNHIRELRQSLKQLSGEKLRQMSDEIRRQEEEGTLVVGVPKRK